jgi:hypothetical protein
MRANRFLSAKSIDWARLRRFPPGFRQSPLQAEGILPREEHLHGRQVFDRKREQRCEGRVIG